MFRGEKNRFLTTFGLIVNLTFDLLDSKFHHSTIIIAIIIAINSFTKEKQKYNTLLYVSKLKYRCNLITKDKLIP